MILSILSYKKDNKPQNNEWASLERLQTEFKYKLVLHLERS